MGKWLRGDSQMGTLFFVMAWTVLSLPAGVLVGKMLAEMGA